MATLASGRAKWEGKTQNAGEKWKSAVGDTGAWQRGLQAAGVTPGPLSTAAYQAGVGRVTASDFNQAIAGKGQKWEDNFRRGISR